MAKKEPTPEEKRSIAELTGIIASKDQALAVQAGQLATQAENLEGQAQRITELETYLEEARVLMAEHNSHASHKSHNSENPSAGIADLESAVNVLKAEGFEVFTEAKITDCRDEEGNRPRSFRNQGRYEVVLARGRKRI